ncbi:hypothetical protein BB8028_0003g07760 [Beauveria bassiana]|uniref:Uncharacterized protein n=1 Tax=Beauveria bassiana TaxID=176275 RepID=A0A2S7Y7J7_BEABA|nr:hypothetical protein BB8028_0003g07760 [Beauveria bassiana]
MSARPLSCASATSAASATTRTNASSAAARASRTPSTASSARGSKRIVTGVPRSLTWAAQGQIYSTRKRPIGHRIISHGAARVWARFVVHWQRPRCKKKKRAITIHFCLNFRMGRSRWRLGQDFDSDIKYDIDTAKGKSSEKYSLEKMLYSDVLCNLISLQSAVPCTRHCSEVRSLLIQRKALKISNKEMIPR